MKRLFLLLGIVALVTTSSCEGPQGFDGAPGPQGPAGSGTESEVFELQNVNFSYDATNGYNIYQTLNPNILASDNILIYRMSGTIDASTPIWQSIPRTLFLTQGELDYDFDFSKEDFTIYAGGTYDLATTPSYIQNQTFRIVIIPGYFSNRSANATVPQVDLTNYNEVIAAYHIDDSNVKRIN